MIDPSPTIHVVDDDDSLRKAVMRLLRAAGYEVRGYATSGEFLMMQPASEPGCLILDVCMPGPSGLELQKALTRQGNGLPIIFLTGHGDIPMSVRAMKAGAVDFLTKPVQREALLCAVRTALRQDATNRLYQDHVNSLQARSSALTSRERAVLAMVVQGMLNKQIAAALGIAERTVKAHRAQVMAKMQVESLAELVRIADQLEIRDA
jgi:FixJ family two-component response regulator